MYVSVNCHNIITAISEHYFEVKGQKTKEIIGVTKDQLGNKLEQKKKPINELKVAAVCNWHDTCGISTYTKFLIDSIRPLVKEIKIFSEINPKPTHKDSAEVVRTWKRGQSMHETIKQLLAWQPDFVIIQHEFGIFPKATYFLQMLHMLEDTAYIVTLHSVYEHLDKIVCTSAIKNIVVHSEQAKKCLEDLGHSSKIFVIPHGCLELEDNKELWNIFQTPHVIIQFGFGFFYKGVDRALDAVSYLKEKYKDIFYVYLCSDTGNFNNVHSEYYRFLLDKINQLNLHDNVAIIRRFQSDQVLNSYLRTAKVAIFPYVTNPKHRVFGASGAIRVSMANKIPVIASESHQFDDVDGVLPRPHDHISLAEEIDKVFSDSEHRKDLLGKINKYIKDNSWEITAKRYLESYYKV